MMNAPNKWWASVVFILLYLVCQVSCWDNDEFEVFDAVEEINKNFYEFLSVPQTGSTSEIKKAFRRLSLVLHPDKNDDPDAESQFRQLATIYDILKDENKRQIYDKVLVEGLPNWRHPIYYFRRVRKLSFYELTALLIVIFTIGQYLFYWASYFEKRLTLDDALNAKLKKIERKKQKGKVSEELEEIRNQAYSQIAKPSGWNLWPFQLVRFVKGSVVAAPEYVQRLKEEVERKKAEKEAALEKEREEERLLEEQKEKKPRRRKAAPIPELNESDYSNIQPVPMNVELKEVVEIDGETHEFASTEVSGSLWTDDDIAMLVKLMKRHPGGVKDRWQNIASAMKRSAYEVAKMACRLKEKGYKYEPSNTSDNETTADVNGDADDSDSDDPSDKWTQKQQKLLENALVQFPKGVEDRWDRIAEIVPGKTKEDCMKRFKYLADYIKQKKR